jgi:hypothetical protein
MPTSLGLIPLPPVASVGTLCDWVQSQDHWIIEQSLQIIAFLIWVGGSYSVGY